MGDGRSVNQLCVAVTGGRQVNTVWFITTQTLGCNAPPSQIEKIEGILRDLGWMYVDGPMVGVVPTRLTSCDFGGYCGTYTSGAVADPGEGGNGPTSCTATKNGNINYGGITDTEINGKKAQTSIEIKWKGDASVVVKFVSQGGEGTTTLPNGITV